MALKRFLLPLAALLLPLLLALPVLTYPLGRDQGVFATLGEGMLRGAVPFVDLWDFKPPAIYAVYAGVIALFGPTSAAIRSLDFLFVLPLLLMLLWLASTVANRRVGLWAVLIFSVFYFTESFWTLSQNDGVALLPMMAAVGASVKAARSSQNRLRWASAAGACLGLAFWFKYPFLIVGLVCAAAYMEFDRRQKLMEYVRVLAAGLMGCSIVVGLGVVWLLSIDALNAWLESVQTTASYNALGLDAKTLIQSMFTYWGFRWSHWGLLFLIAGFGLALRWRSQLGRLSGIWLLITFVLMLIQLRGFDYHWLPMLPSLALFAALGMDALTADRRNLAFGLAAGLLAVLILSLYPPTLPYLTGQESRTDYAARFIAGEFDASESEQTAAYLTSRVAAGDSLYIWGFRPEIYFLSGLRPATRFISQFPLVTEGYPATWPQENVDTLWAALPPYVIVAQVDYMPWVTGRNEDSNTLLQEYTELNNWLIYNYERDNQIGNLFLWKRKPQPESSSALAS